jgi:parvulin-like peptidyl-prolyl isomerase
VVAPDGAGAAGDLPVALVDGATVHAGEVYRLLLLSLPDETQNAARQLVVDRVAAAEAAAASIEVPAAAVDRELERVLGEQDRKVRESSKGKQDLATYVQQTYSLDKAAYAELVRGTVARSLLLERVVLLELSKHPRTQLRLIRVKERPLAEEIRKKVVQGADFATLARQHSEDGSARDGGLYPPLPSDLPSPLFARTEGLKGGDVGEVEEVSTNDGPRFRIVQVLTRLPAEAGSWTERGAGIDKVLDGRALSPLELEAWMHVMETRHPIRILPLGALAHGS